MDASAQFRMTVWPQVPLPHPRGVTAYATFGLVDGDLRMLPGTRGTRGETAGSIVFARWRSAGRDPEADWARFIAEIDAETCRTPWVPGEQQRREADGETYLRLCALDLDDDDAVLRFVNTYGTLGMHRAGTDARADAVYRGFTLEPGSDAVIDRLISSRESAEDALHAHPPDDRFVWETLEEFRFGARCIRDLARAWQTVHAGAPPPPRATWEADVWHSEGSDQPLNDDPWAPRGPERLLATYLTDSLVAFAPAVRLTRLLPDEDPKDLSPYEDVPQLYDVMCLEIFNHIVENAIYRTCANESCRRTFVRQHGRAQHHQNRTSGVRYCSADCARAQASRDYRRRKRARGASPTT